MCAREPTRVVSVDTKIIYNRKHFYKTFYLIIEISLKISEQLHN